MDKKKVKELMDKAKEYILTYQRSKKSLDLAMAFLNIQNAEREFSKSDWVSVEDELPKYNEMVWVRSKENTQLVWSSYRTKNKTQEVDENCFLMPAVLEIHITHWKPIEKLED